MPSLSAEKRDVFGKRLGRVSRAERLPGVLYGRKEKATSVFVPTREFKKLWREAGETTVVTLKLPDAEKEVMIHQVDFDPVKDEPIHVDFYAIEAGKAIEVSVPLEFTGTSPAVKQLGGTLVKVLHEIEIEAEPKKIPHEITVDISSLVDFDRQIAVKDLPLPEGVVAKANPDEIVAAVSAPRGEKEEEEEEGPADISQIEVEKKGKREEEGAEEEGTSS